MNETMEIKEEGAHKKVSKLDLFLRSILSQSLKGHNASIKILFALLEQYLTKAKCEAREIQGVKNWKKYATPEEAREAWQKALAEALEED